MSAERKEWIGDEVSLRWLPPDEYFRLQFLFMANGGQLPSATHSKIIVAEDENGDIVGCFCFQVVAHAEPLWVSEDYRQRGVAKLMIDELNKHCDENELSYYSFAENERVAHICTENGMQQLPYVVFLRKPEPKE